MISRLLMVLVLLATAACTDDAPQAQNPPPIPPSTGPDLQPLRRPWAHAAIAPGTPCAVTQAVTQPDPGLGPMLGDGPARAVGIAAGAVLEYEDPKERADWTDKTWGGQKVLWAVDPAVSGPVLVRGRRLDGAGELAFEDPVIPELLLNVGDYEGQPGGWKDTPSFTRVRGPGCYAYQIDTAQASWTIVFVAKPSAG